MTMKKRVEQLEAIKQPGPPPIVIIKEGEPVPEGAKIVIVDNINIPEEGAGHDKA